VELLYLKILKDVKTERKPGGWAFLPTDFAANGGQTIKLFLTGCG